MDLIYRGFRSYKVNVIPPQNIYEAWTQNYENMRKNMIYVEAKPFDELIAELKALNARINEIG